MIPRIREKLLGKNIHIFVIVFFELMGTTLFAYINLNLINQKGDAKTQAAKIFYFFVDFSLSMFICISYGRQFSGGVYNPSNSLFRIFRRTDRYPWRIGLLYISMQMLGGLIGSFLGNYSK